MNLPAGDTDTELFSSIPPVICINPREKIESQQVSIAEVLKHQSKSEDALTKDSAQLSRTTTPIPRYPLSIEWSPSVMFFDIANTKVNLQNIRIWNACSRSIYINCCGLWGDVARLGAKWRCYPRTRFLLSPGLTADLFIQATPKEQSPIPNAQMAIQLAAGHKRDPVVGYFVIPIIVKFQKYIKPCLGEVEASNI